MLKIQLDNSPYFQQNFLISQNHRIRLSLRYNSIGEHWAMDVFDYQKNDFVAQGVALVVGVPLLWRHPVDYCFLLNDISGLDIDPVSVNDLATRFELFLVMKSELK